MPGPQVYQVGGQGQSTLEPFMIQSARAPTTTDTVHPNGFPYPAGYQWQYTATNGAKTFYFYEGAGVWVVNEVATGSVVTMSDTSGTPVTPNASGNIQLSGTTAQITMTAGTNKITASLPSAITAPGSLVTTTTLAATTTVTAGTGITATLGDITATNGNFVGSTAGKGLLFNANTATGAASGPVVLNSRAGQVIFTGVSIAAAADLTLTITNSAITASSTQVVYSMAGATTGSALSIKSVTNSSGSSAVVVTNGTGATTTTANIALTFLVLN